MIVPTVILLCLLDTVSGHASHSKLLLISLDGFRHDYLDIVKNAGASTPNFDRLQQEGVLAEVVNVFPTKTLPNHYTIVTGLYPEHHGVVHNMFYDPIYNESFEPDHTTDNKWYNGTDPGRLVEPIWITNQKSKQTLFPKRSGVFHWPGSEASLRGQHALHYEVYDNTYTANIPFDIRAKTVVNWFANEEAPINLGILYYREPDATAHMKGPFSDEVRNMILEIDKGLGVLIELLEEHHLYEHMNIIVTSDHGMANINNELYLSDYIDSADYKLYGGSPVLLLQPLPGKEDKIYKNLKDVRNITVYRKNEIPEEYHYQENRRITDMLVVADLGWDILSDRSQNKTVVATHGYDNALSDMHPLLIARGPAFKVNVTLGKPVRMVDLYELMCHVLDIEPNRNDGSLEKVEELLNEEEEEESEGVTLITMLAVLVLTATVSGICCVAACRVHRINIRHQRHARHLAAIPINNYDNSFTHLLNESEEEIP